MYKVQRYEPNIDIDGRGYFIRMTPHMYGSWHKNQDVQVVIRELRELKKRVRRQEREIDKLQARIMII